MKKVIIKNRQEEVLQTTYIDTQEKIDDFMEVLSKGEAWGKPEHQILISPPELNEAGEVIVEAIYETIPSAYLVEIEDVTEEFGKAQIRNERIARGHKARQVCEACLDLIAGINLERSLTGEQISQMQNSFGQIQMALLTSRPSAAKAAITALQPDGVLITEEMKESVLELLVEY